MKKEKTTNWLTKALSALSRQKPTPSWVVAETSKNSKTKQVLKLPES